MTDASPSFDAWSRQWLEAQQQAWSAWLGGTAPPPADDPAAALAGWLGDGATQAGELGARLLAQGQQFLQLAGALGEELTAATRDGGEPDWQAVFDATITRVSEALAPNGDGNAHPAGALGGLLDEWRKVALRMGLPEAPAAQGGAAMAGYVAALQAYGAQLADVQRDALERLRRELDDQQVSGGTITSLRALYDLWVDASEAAYAERAVAPDFAAAQAALAHALCRLQTAREPRDG